MKPMKCRYVLGSVLYEQGGCLLSQQLGAVSAEPYLVLISVTFRFLCCTSVDQSSSTGTGSVVASCWTHPFPPSPPSPSLRVMSLCWHTAGRRLTGLPVNTVCKQTYRVSTSSDRPEQQEGGKIFFFSGKSSRKLKVTPAAELTS